ncbi:MAG: hypothetical protein FJ405_19240 [Verrucomicrobia bacterium]|nr:hypothetical protein [Verrucomicrobiota bacterium]
MNQFAFIAEDLAPGDRRILPWDSSTLTCHRITSPQHPWFRPAYDRLWATFGAADEMETQEVILRRLTREPMRETPSGALLHYELAAAEAQGCLVATRDHTIIVPDPEHMPGFVVIHMSHILVEPHWRRTGLAAWMRALPLQTARRVLGSLGWKNEPDIILAAEMEPEDGSDARAIRLKAYGKAGFCRVPPEHLPYRQPDFRSAAVIDQTGGPRPLPFLLLLRRVGKEDASHVESEELRRVVKALYSMYAEGFRPQDMSPVWDWIQNWQAPAPLVPVARGPGPVQE